MQTALTFDDVQIIPQYSEIISRNTVTLASQFTRHYTLTLPFVASPMPDVCETEMAIAMWRAGGVGVIHRFNTIDEQCQMVTDVITQVRIESPAYSKRYARPVIAAAIGVTDDYLERAAELVRCGVNVLMIDVAHGHHINVRRALDNLRTISTFNDHVDIIAGTVATNEGAADIRNWGADAIRVGVGGGSACETRIRTGVGIPQLQALLDVDGGMGIPILSDGGIRYPGDVAKAIAAGANTVMIGNLFAGTDEAPGSDLITGRWPDHRIKRIYKGAASATQKLNHTGAATYVEGATKIIDARGPVQSIIDSLQDGLRSSLSYVGVDNIEEFQMYAQFIGITPAGIAEAHPHMLLQS